MEEVIVERRDRVLVIVINRPERMNALTMEMMGEMGRIIKQAYEDDSGAIMITGAGRAFSSGLDIKILSEGKFEEREVELTQIIYNSPKPVIAAINGVCVGGAFSLALSCDMRIASDEAFFSMIYIKRGIVPTSGATFFLPRMVGYSKALEIMLTGDFIDAEEALRLGIVNKVVPHSKLFDEALDFARKLSKGPPIATRLLKKLLREGKGDLSEQIRAEREANKICYSTEDFREGVMAFIERREPNFKGK